jgi:tagatose-6-phosphate ketose/aldose isomerase
LNALANLLELPNDMKAVRGLLHTPREIAQQPATWQSTFDCFHQRRLEIREFLKSAGIGQHSPRRPTVFLLGAGTSDYIGKSLFQLLRRHWHCEVIAVPSTDLLTHLEEFIVPDQRYLWISFSRSGDSPEGVAVLQRALRSHPDIHHLIVSCNASGQMIREIAGKPQALGICLDDAVNDRGLAMTSSFSNLVIFGQCLANIETASEYEGVLAELAGAGKGLLGAAANCATELAGGPYNKACFVGSGPLRSVASESALKLLEMTAGKTQTMSESALGLRHGPMAALNAETLFVCFLSGDDRVRKYEVDLLEQIGNKRLVRTRVIVAREWSRQLGALAEHVVTPGTTFTVADDYRPPVDAIFGQLLGLFFSLRWGLKPDCPSPNGAISRVVQEVSIYG